MFLSLTDNNSAALHRAPIRCGPQSEAKERTQRRHRYAIAVAKQQQKGERHDVRQLYMNSFFRSPALPCSGLVLEYLLRNFMYEGGVWVLNVGKLKEQTTTQKKTRKEERS
jgi:hypothetical protein